MYPFKVEIIIKVEFSHDEPPVQETLKTTDSENFESILQLPKAMHIC
jgi:hypothetical protein